MTAIQVIEEAQSAGILLSVEGDKLKVKGQQSPTYDQIVALIKPIKLDVIAALSSGHNCTQTVDIRTLPPIRNHTGRPALPPGHWVSGISTLGEALATQHALSAAYGVSLGLDALTGLYFLRCPGWQWIAEPNVVNVDLTFTMPEE